MLKHFFKHHKIQSYISLICLLVSVILINISACAGEVNDEPRYDTLESLEGKRIGCITGTADGQRTAEHIKDIELMYYNNNADLVMAVQSGAIDAAVCDIACAYDLLKNSPNLTLASESPYTNEYYYVACPNEQGSFYIEQINEFMEKCRDNGVLQEMEQFWVYDLQTKPLDISDLEGTNGVIEVVTDPVFYPFSFVENGEVTGFDMEFFYLFAREYGYGINLNQVTFASAMLGLAEGKYDILATGINKTPERAESVLFSDRLMPLKEVLIVQKVDSSAIISSSGGSFIDNIKSGIERNFIREDRYKLVLSGILVTIEISIYSTILGTLLGFFVCLGRRSKNPIVYSIASVYVRILQGTPVLIILMILYYIVFNNTGLKDIWIAVAGFSLNFAAYTGEMFRSGIDSVDRGQKEAAEALGFSPTQGFFRVILPQASQVFLPVYKGEFISLIKSTSIVGYVAIQDLTKVGDIIRSRTFDAFFPLISTAIIYFILTWVLSIIINALISRIDISHRKINLKGIDTTQGCNDDNSLNYEGNTGEVLISLSHVKKVYEFVTPLMDVNTEIRRGDCISIIGPSGTGKSTLLRCINRLDPPTEGTITVFGEVMPDKGKKLYEMRRKMGMVFQSFNLFPHLTIIENIMLAPRLLLKVSPQEAYNKGMLLLKQVGLTDKALVYPESLSGGQKQRVAIARTLAMQPELVLFDEPTSALDPTMVSEVLSVIKGLKEKGLTMLIVTHEMKFAENVSNRIFYMDEGVIYDDGTPEVIFHGNVKDKTRRFIHHLKELKIEKTSEIHDFPGDLSAIESFCHKELFDYKATKRIFAIIEELYEISLNRHYRETGQEIFNAAAVISHQENDDVILLQINYDGPKYDLLEEGDELSNKIVRLYSDSLYYDFSDSINHITIELKQ